MSDAKLIFALMTALRELVDRDLTYFDNVATIEVSRAQIQDARQLIEIAAAELAP